MKYASISALLIVVSSTAQAFSISEQSEYSSQQFYQNIFVDQDFAIASTDQVPQKNDDEDADDEDQPFNWSAGATYQRFSLDSDGSTLTDHTLSYVAGLGWFGEHGFGVNLKANYADTPEEAVTVRGGRLGLSYHHTYAKPEQNEVFLPFWGIRLDLVANDFKQTYSGETPRKNGKLKPTSGEQSLTQKMIGVGANWKPIRQLKMDVEIDYYGYSADVQKLEARLDTPAAVQKGLGGFGDTVGGLARVAYSLGLTEYFNKRWDVSIYWQYSRLAADNSVSTDAKIQSHLSLGKSWTMLFGFENQSSDSFRDNLGILGFEFAT